MPSTKKPEKRYVVYAHYQGDKANKVVLETDDEREAADYQWAHRRGAGLKGAYSVSVTDRKLVAEVEARLAKRSADAEG